MIDLAYQNEQVISLVYARMGCISWNMRVISLIPRGRGATFHFLLETDSAKDWEESDDIVFEYFVLQDNGVDGDVNASITIIDNRDLTPNDLTGRVVYIRKDVAPRTLMG